MASGSNLDCSKVGYFQLPCVQPFLGILRDTGNCEFGKGSV